MNKHIRLLTHISLAAVMLTLIDDAHAIPISGNPNFAGTASGTQSGGISTLTFDNPVTFTFGSGDYAAVAAGTPATFMPISWSGSGPLPTPIPLWTMAVGGTTYRFDLTFLGITTMTSNEVFLQGFGILSISGEINRDPTAGIVRIQGSGENFNYTVAVPEPQPVAYIICTAAALALCRWRWRRARNI